MSNPRWRTLALLLNGLLVSGPLLAQDSLGPLRDQLNQALGQQLVAPIPGQDPSLLPAVQPIPAGTEERKLIESLLDRAKSDPVYGVFSGLLTRLDGLSNRTLSARSASRGGSWPDLEFAGPEEWPEWLTELVATRVQALSLAQRAGPVPVAAPGRGRQQLVWGSLRGPIKNGETTPSVPGNVADAIVWAGPAVRDAVATYRQTGGKSVVRIALAELQANNLYLWAKRFGFAMELRLRKDTASTSEPIIDGRTSIPVAILQPEGLQPATIQAFAVGGDACSGGNWVEIALENAGQPPIWAVFAFSRPELQQGVSVRRLPAPKETERPYLEARRSELELRWPGDWLPPITVLARRFEYTTQRYAALPNGEMKLESTEVVGSAWATQAWTVAPAASASDAGARALLTAGGSPACAPP